MSKMVQIRATHIVMTFEKIIIIPNLALDVSCDSAPYCIVFCMVLDGAHFGLSHHNNGFFTQEGLKILYRTFDIKKPHRVNVCFVL